MDIRIDFIQNSTGGNSTYIRGILASASAPEIRLPQCQEERKSDWVAGKKPFVLLGCCCTAVLLYFYFYTAVLLRYCWGDFSKFQWGGINIFENSLGVQDSHRKCTGVEKISKKTG